jgi:cytidylate kinase
MFFRNAAPAGPDRPHRKSWDLRFLIVTISREYGAAAQAVARALAAVLGYRLVDEELPRLIAARLGTSTDVVESLSDRAAGFGERLLAGFAGAVPEVTAPAEPPHEDLTEAYRREAERLIAAAADAGNVVILGRLGSVILGARRDLVRVFVYAPLAWRVRNVSTSLGCDAAKARTEINRIDDARRTLAREQYRMAWGDIRNYDLAVNTARYGVDGAAAVIAAAVQAALPA